MFFQYVAPMTKNTIFLGWNINGGHTKGYKSCHQSSDTLTRHNNSTWMTNSSRYFWGFSQHFFLYNTRVTFRGLVWSLEAFLVFTRNLHHWVGNHKFQIWPHGKINIIVAKCSFQLSTRLMTLIFQLLEIFQKAIPNQSTQMSYSNWDSAYQEARHSSVSLVICVEIHIYLFKIFYRSCIQIFIVPFEWLLKLLWLTGFWVGDGASCFKRILLSSQNRHLISASRQNGVWSCPTVK